MLNNAIDEHCVRVADKSSCAIVPSQADGSSLNDFGVERFMVDGLMVSEVQVGSYADGLALAPTGDRLYVPIRSDNDITFVDVDTNTGGFDCREPGTANFGTSHACDDDFRKIDLDFAKQHQIVWPPDPVDIVVGPVSDFERDQADAESDDGNYIAVAHRNGAVSLLIEDEIERGANTMMVPTLVDSIVGLSPELVTLGFDTKTGNAWLPSAQVRLVERVGVAIAPTNALSFVSRLNPIVMDDLSVGDDIRQIVFDPRPDVSRVYMASRSPEALLVYDGRDIEQAKNLIAEIPVGIGTSRLQLATLPVGGVSRTLAFVTCFDSRDVHIIDVDNLQSLTAIKNVTGAFELVIDAGRQRLYVVDFRSSVVRVFDLSVLDDCYNDGIPLECAPQALGLLGYPEPVEELR
ncbi:MAG: hypothetical protein R3A47_07955 [Polyangiales bacterium]